MCCTEACLPVDPADETLPETSPQKARRQSLLTGTSDISLALAVITTKAITRLAGIRLRRLSWMMHRRLVLWRWWWQMLLVLLIGATAPRDLL